MLLKSVAEINAKVMARRQVIVILRGIVVDNIIWQVEPGNIFRRVSDDKKIAEQKVISSVAKSSFEISMEK